MAWNSGGSERRVRLLPAALLLLAIVWPLPCAQADQNDPALAQLFTALRDQDAVRGKAVEERIWLIWFQTADRVAASLLDEGTTLMGRRRWADALERFDQLVVRAPGFAEGWNKRATAYFLMGDLDRSVLDIQRTLALEPRHFGALAGLGQIYLRVDWPQAALRAFEKALTINPNMPGVRRQVDDLRAAIQGSDI